MRRILAVSLVLAACALPARAAPPVLAFSCNGADGSVGMMENEYVAATGKGDCWFHLGHHTYDMGAPYRIGRVTGSLFSVEIEYSPATDIDANGPELAFESSLDGVTWLVLHQMPFDLTLDRQTISFDFDGGGALARFVRIHQPRSLAQGLSGYIDNSHFTMEAERGPIVDPLPPTDATRSLVCARDAMERFFDVHPCWFGGINRYDAPSVYQTYPLGRATIDRVTGTATFLPWRTDDYNNGASRTDVVGYVQMSENSINWRTIGSMTGKYGTSLAFDLQNLGGVRASFVRVVSDYDHGYRNDPSLKHVRGFVFDSAISVTGTFS